MATKNSKPKASETIQINGQEYPVDCLTDEQKILCSHLMDLDRKMAQMQFNIEQLGVGRAAFMARLESSLKLTEHNKKAA